MSRRSFRVVAVLAALATACTKSEPVPDGGSAATDSGPGAVVTDACGALVTALCAYSIRCESLGVSQAACVEVESSAFPECERGLVASGEVQTLNDAVEGCLGALSDAGCGGADVARVQTACNGPFFAGAVALGGACTTDESCAGFDGGAVGCFRGLSWSSCGGTCSAGQPLGAACARYVHGGGCSSGYCASADGGYFGNCAPFATLGQSCASAACDPTTYCQAQTCAERVSDGGACSGDVCAPGLHCAGNACHGVSAHGGSCVSGDYQGCSFPDTCIDGICQTTYAFVGQPCGGAVECEDSSCVDGTCTAAPGLGEACTDSCQSAYDCVDGTCHARAALGEACASSYACRSGLWCSDGGCAPLARYGEACTSSGAGPRCQWGYCDATSRVCKRYEAPEAECTDDSQCAAVIDAHTCAVQDDGGPSRCNTCDPIN